MPVNSAAIQTFDPADEDHWFYGFMSRQDATELLTNNNETGAFIVRESTTARGDLVLSVKERDDKVSHYIINRITPNDKSSSQVHFKIGEQIFYDVPALLSYYMRNNLDDTPLRVPAKAKDLPFNHIRRSFTKDYLAEIQSESIRNNSQQEANKNNSSQNNINNNNGNSNHSSLPSSLQRQLPSLAKVIQTRIPNAYDKTALTLRVNDIVKVTKMDVSGCWEGEIGGRKGHFPFNYVKFIDD